MKPSHILKSAGDGKVHGRVLLVDDDPAILLSLARILEHEGHQVEGVSEAESAVNLVAREKFDIVVSDIGLPGMDGLQLLRLVHEQDHDLPVVLMTGLPTIESAISAVAHGAIHYMVKPFGSAAMIDLISRSIQLYRVATLRRQALQLVGDDSTQLGDRASLTANFERALGSLWMAYQPIVSVKDRSIFAYEALLRCDEPSLPHPGAFLDAAEQLDRLTEVGRAVRERVAAQAPECPAPHLFINLHPRDLLDDSLYSPLSPLSRIARRVVLEITERASLDYIGDASSRITVLRKMGFRIAVDDLGAGYAGLTSFAHLDPDVVKFDMSLVRNVHTNAKKLRLIQSMSALFREMNLLIVGEGVEVVEEREAMAEAGCDLLQGYLFARPAKGFCGINW